MATLFALKKWFTPLRLFEVGSNGGGTAVNDQVSVSIEDFIGGVTVHLLTVIWDLDNLCEPLPSGPGSGWIEQESFRNGPISLAAQVFPYAMTGSSKRGWKTGRSFS